MSIPWIEKYRPQTLNDIVSHKIVIKTLKKFMQNNSLPHMIFYGPPGTGKTSTILACAHELYGEKQKFMTFELNASDDRGINIVRNIIRDFASTKRMFKGHTIIILDEADSLTIDAQYALRSIMDTYIENTIFCLICNYISKIIPPIVSRCTRFHFVTIPSNHIQTYINMIASKENLNITSNGLKRIIRSCHGDLRMAINIIQSTSMSYTVISEENIVKCLGIPNQRNLRHVLEILLSENSFKGKYHALKEYINDHYIMFNELIDALFEHLISEQFGINIYKNLFELQSNWLNTKKTNIHIAALISLFNNTDMSHFQNPKMAEGGCTSLISRIVS